MEKIKALLEKSGIDVKLASQICEALVDYQGQIRTQYEAQLTEAKRLCIEETEAHKRELARRLTIFCEARTQAVDAAIAKQSAHRNTEATAKLQQLKSLLEGVAIAEPATGKTQASIQKLQQQLKTVSEERDRAVANANRQTSIARKLVQNNQLLEQRLARSRALTEGRAPAAAPTTLESVRREGKPRTTRPTLLENQQRNPPAPQRTGKPETQGAVSAIAAAMDAAY